MFVGLQLCLCRKGNEYVEVILRSLVTLLMGFEYRTLPSLIRMALITWLHQLMLIFENQS